ncbi:hypothetical protein [Dactylosporangium cerinum]
MHVGRLYTCGDVFLAMDATLRASWLGHTDDVYDEVCELDEDVTSIPVGPGRAALIAIDGRPNDEGWIEVFTSGRGTVAFVFAAGQDYPATLPAALAHQHRDSPVGDLISLDSGHLAVFSAATDGAGPYSSEFVPARPAPIPVAAAPLSSDPDPGVLLQLEPGNYRFDVEPYVEPGGDLRFGRWTLTHTTTS